MHNHQKQRKGNRKRSIENANANNNYPNGEWGEPLVGSKKLGAFGNKTKAQVGWDNPPQRETNANPKRYIPNKDRSPYHWNNGTNSIKCISCIKLVYNPHTNCHILLANYVLKTVIVSVSIILASGFRFSRVTNSRTAKTRQKVRMVVVVVCLGGFKP